MVQQIDAENYSFRYSVFNFIKKVTLIFQEETTWIRSQLILKGRLKVKTQEEINLYLREGQFLLFNSKNNFQTAHFEKGKEYWLFEADYSIELLKPLLLTFPSLNKFIDNFSTTNELLKIKQPRFATPEMTKIVYDLFRCPYDENLRKQYFENKVNDFLFEVLAKTFNGESSKGNLTQKENDAVLDARELILNDITKHFTIKEISQRVQLNEFKLKSGFKEVFGMGLFEFLLQARMEKARQLLIETDKPMKEIAALTGFEFLTNFIAAFRKYFGYTPGELRRK